MKKIVPLLLGLALTGSVQADPLAAISAFEVNARTKEALKRAAVRISTLHGGVTSIERERPTAALLNGSCGFAGCSTVYLVTQGLTPNTVNAQTLVVGAEVEVLDGTGMVRKVLDSEQMDQLRSLLSR